MIGFLEGLGSMAGPSAYLVVGALAALESSAFVGLFIPGEVALLAGGYIAFQGKAGLGTMMVVATVGAIVGDSIGYEIGRHLGGSIRRSRLGRRVGEARWLRAEKYLALKGGRAVFFGRFIGVLRALVPALAGVTRMPYRRFVFWNALGAVIWAPGFVLLGYVAGGSYRRIEHYAGQAGLVLLILVVMLGSVAALGHWVSRHPDQVRAFGRRLLARPLPARIHRRYHAQLEFLGRRLRPRQVLGLALTLQLIALGLAAWAFGVVVEDVLSGNGAALVDRPISTAMVEHQVGWLTGVMRGISVFGSAPVLVAVTMLVGLVAWRISHSWAPLIIVAAALAGGLVLSDSIKPLVGRVGPVGQVDFAFPSAEATQGVAVYGALAYLAAGWSRTWTAKVVAWTVAVVVVLLLGFSRVYLGAQWTTDVLGGYALGAVWLAVVLVTTSAVRGAWRRRRPPVPIAVVADRASG